MAISERVEGINLPQTRFRQVEKNADVETTRTC